MHISAKLSLNFAWLSAQLKRKMTVWHRKEVRNIDFFELYFVNGPYDDCVYTHFICFSFICGIAFETCVPLEFKSIVHVPYIMECKTKCESPNRKSLHGTVLNIKSNSNFKMCQIVIENGTVSSSRSAEFCYFTI